MSTKQTQSFTKAEFTPLALPFPSCLCLFSFLLTIHLAHALLSLFLVYHLYAISPLLFICFPSVLFPSVCMCVCVLSQLANYFPSSHSHSVPCGVRALISHCYISSRVQMLMHMSLRVLYAQTCEYLVKDKNQLSAEAVADTTSISLFFFLFLLKHHM